MRGNPNGTLSIAILALTISPRSTIPANIFQKSLSERESILDTSPAISITPRKRPITISNILAINVTRELTSGTIPIPLYQIYLVI